MFRVYGVILGLKRDSCLGVDVGYIFTLQIWDYLFGLYVVTWGSSSPKS